MGQHGGILSHYSKRRWILGGTSVAALLVLVLVMSNLSPLRQPDVVHAMEDAIREVRYYLGALEIVWTGGEGAFQPEVEVPVDLEVERADQRNADGGHSVYKLDPVYAAQVFVSLEISPEGIQGDYPIKETELKLIHNNGERAIVTVLSRKTIIRNVYLERLIRKDSTGIWTVVGYDLEE